MNLPDFLLQLKVTTAVTIALVPLLFFFVLLLHEMGHYAAARMMGLKVDDVHIGKGKTLWQGKDRRGTRWTIGALPIWAHVHIANFSWPCPLWKRFLVVLAGPIANLLLPFFLLSAFYVTFGQPATPAILTAIEIEHAADIAGMKPGDHVTAVDGIPVHHYDDVRRKGYDPEKEAVFEVKRGDETLTFPVRPRVYSFVDTDGIERTTPRLGVIWSQKAFRLQNIDEVGGIDTRDNSDKALALLQENFGKDVSVGLQSNDSKTHLYRIHPLRKINDLIAQEGQEEYKMLFLGQGKDDFYYQGSFLGNLAEAWRDGAELTGKVLTLPFQLLPIDPLMLAPSSLPYRPETWLPNMLFRLTYLGCLASLLMGFINLLPLPLFDGSIILFQIMEHFLKRPPNIKERTIALMAAFALIYFTVFMFNYDKLPRYIESRIHKVQEYMKQ